MQAWIGHIQSLAFCMEEAKIEVTDQDWILMLMMGLPASYGAVIINFDSTAPEHLTLNHVITQLLNEEAQQSSNSVMTIDEEGIHDEALITMQKSCDQHPCGAGKNTLVDVTPTTVMKKGITSQSVCKERNGRRSKGSNLVFQPWH
jgi:gag-polypeptide of LTR copia-type